MAAESPATPEETPAPEPAAGLTLFGRTIPWLAIALVVLVVVGAALRLYRIDDIPPGMNQDEAVHSYDAWSIVTSGRDHLGHPVNLVAFENFGDWAPPALTIALTPAAALVGLDLTLLRSWVAILALLAVPFTWLAGRTLFGGRWSAFAAAVVVAILPWSVAQERWVIPMAIVPAVTAALMFGLAWTARKESGTGAVLTAMVAAIGIATYQSMRAYVLLLVMAALVAWLRRYLRIGWRSLAVAAATFLVVAVPTFLFVLRDRAGGMRLEQVSVFTPGNPMLPEGTTVNAAFLIHQYLGYFGPGFLLGEGSNYEPWVLPRGDGVVPLTFVILAAIGAVALVVRIVRPRDDWQRGTSIFLLLALLLYPVPGAVTLPSPTAARVTHVIPVMALVIGFGLLEVARSLRSMAEPKLGLRQQQVLFAALAIVTLVAVGVDAGHHLHTYEAQYPLENKLTFHDGLEPMIDWAWEHHDAYDQVWITSVNEPYIFLLFYGEVDPQDARPELVIQRDPPAFNWIVRYQNFYATPRMYILPPEDISISGMVPVYQTRGVDGEVAFEARSGTVNGRGKVLVIFRPDMVFR